VKLVLAATGGTIASLPDPATGAVRAALAPGDLVAAAGLASEIEVEVVEIDRINGWNVTPELMLRLARCLHDRLGDESVAGAIVTHGTDTVEETAFLVELLVASEKPVAFAAAMRTGDELGADGPRNLRDAMQVAGAEDARGWGALLVMNDEIHSARWCVKTDSFRPSALASPGFGPVGYVTPGHVRIDPAPPRFLLDIPARLPEVPVLTTYTGMTADVARAVVERTAPRGLVVQGTGLGNVPGPIVPVLRELIDAGVVVVIATRVATGGTAAVYGGPGGGVMLRDEGVIPAAGLSAAKARLLLMVALAVASDHHEAARLFRTGAHRLAPGAFGAG
jgi:L-asparaginase